MSVTLRLFDGFAHTTPNLKGEVMQLQNILIKKGYRITASGEFSPATQQAVKYFQQVNKLPVTGVVDAATWQKLLAGTTTPAPTPAVKPTVITSTAPVYQMQTNIPRQDPRMLKNIEAMRAYSAIISEVSTRYGIQASIIAAIGSRESDWGLGLTPPGPEGTGDQGHGRGLLQIDDRWHPDFIASGKWSNARENLIYGGALIKSFWDFFTTKGAMPKNSTSLRASIAAYNAGPRRVLEGFQAGEDLDFFTTGRNYSADVFNRAGWFQMNGIR